MVLNIIYNYIIIYIPIGSMYGIYANIWGILMVNVSIYTIHGSYGIYHDHYLLLKPGDIGAAMLIFIRSVPSTGPKLATYERCLDEECELKRGFCGRLNVETCLKWLCHMTLCNLWYFMCLRFRMNLSTWFDVFREWVDILATREKGVFTHEKPTA